MFFRVIQCIYSVVLRIPVASSYVCMLASAYKRDRYSREILSFCSIGFVLLKIQYCRYLVICRKNNEKLNGIIINYNVIYVEYVLTHPYTVTVYPRFYIIFYYYINTGQKIYSEKI